MAFTRLGAGIVMAWFLAASPALADSPIVERARAADQEGRFADVLREAEAARTQADLPAADRAELFRLAASAHAAFGNEPDAILAFRRLLALEPDFTLPAAASPKLRRYLESARAAGSLDEGGPRLPTPRDGAANTTISDRPGRRPADKPAASRPWYKSGWVWGAVTVVAAGTVTAVVLSRENAAPSGANLGEIPLP